MTQCSKYPNSCRGHVRLDRVDETWYCEKHFYEYDHMEKTDRKMKTREKPRILLERLERKRLKEEAKDKDKDKDK